MPGSEMSLSDLLPSVHALGRNEKFRLMQELIADLAIDEGLPAGEYSIWSPYDAHDAADVLTDLLDHDGHVERA